MDKPDSARHDLLIDAIDHLPARRIRIDICGLVGASLYEIRGQFMAESDLVALAFRMGMARAKPTRSLANSVSEHPRDAAQSLTLG